MHIRGLQFVVLAVAVAGIFAIAGACYAFAESATSNSPNYQASQLQFGSGDASETCQGNYCASTSVGGATVGESSSTGYTTKFGAITNSDPLLEVIVDNGVTNLGEFSSSATTYKTMSIKVRNYLSVGYIIQIIGTPPKIDNYTIPRLSSPTASMVGQEQFGMNVVANTTPAIGMDPVQVPSGEFSFGKAATNYATANKFMYNSGDVVALSDEASGETDYTLSVIINVAPNTPAGHYTSDFSAVVIPSY